MDKQNVNTTPSMKGKGDSSSSHYRINLGARACECAVATKFVQWEVQPLETLCACEAYLLRVKLNRGGTMSREAMPLTPPAYVSTSTDASARL